MSRIYRYILVHDSGMAPCPARSVISLATCKPVIRRKAAPGDWVLGFVPGWLHRGLVLWAGRVEHVMSHGGYQRQFRGRPDAVYRELADGSYERLAPEYHATRPEMDRDTSAPVLLFERTVSRYFDGRPESLPRELAHLAAAGRGHRVNGSRPGDIAALEAWLDSLPRSTMRSQGAGGRSGGYGTTSPPAARSSQPSIQPKRGC